MTNANRLFCNFCYTFSFLLFSLLSSLLFQAMNFPVNALSGVPSCTKSVTIRHGSDVLKFKQNRDVLLNGEEIPVLPIWIDGLYVRHVSSVFISGLIFQDSVKTVTVYITLLLLFS